MPLNDPSAVREKEKKSKQYRYTARAVAAKSITNWLVVTQRKNETNKIELEQGSKKNGPLKKLEIKNWDGKSLTSIQKKCTYT